MASGQVSCLAPQSICVRYEGDGVCRVSCDPPLTSALVGRPGAPGSGLELRADRCPVRLERGARSVREAGADGALEGLGTARIDHGLFSFAKSYGRACHPFGRHGDDPFGSRSGSFMCWPGSVIWPSMRVKPLVREHFDRLREPGGQLSRRYRCLRRPSSTFRAEQTV